MRLLSIITLVLSLASQSSASAGSIAIRQHVPSAQSPGCSSGLCINNLGLDATVYTGWINISTYDALTLEIVVTDSDDSMTALTWQCWTSRVTSTANGSGAEVCATETTESGGATTTTYYCPNTYSVTTGTAEHLSATIKSLNANYINCGFTSTGSQASADKLTVYARTRSP